MANPEKSEGVAQGIINELQAAARERDPLFRWSKLVSAENDFSTHREKFSRKELREISLELDKKPSPQNGEFTPDKQSRIVRERLRTEVRKVLEAPLEI
jgi:hypothetical protein